MKRNIFAVNQKIDIDEFPGREAGGKRSAGIESTEEDLVNKIDESGLPEDELVAKRFMEFLSNRRITLDRFEALPEDSKKKVRQYFFDHLEA